MQVENPASSGNAEALSLVLAHELLRPASWQQKRVVDYIEDQLDKEISLRDLAALAQLSPLHFARAFKQSFGEPPHRYHMARRIEHAKTLLKVPARTVTEIATQVKA
jgi:AraC family transcriptional regulator